jgi:hypothetical protein
MHIERLSGKLCSRIVIFLSERDRLQKSIVNAERRGKRQVLIRPSSKVVVKFLSVMQRHGMYISSSRCFFFLVAVIVLLCMVTGVH